MKDLNVFEQEFEEIDEARKNPLAAEIKESFNGDVITAIKYFLNDIYVIGDDVMRIYKLDNHNLISFIYTYDSIENCINIYTNTIYEE